MRQGVRAKQIIKENAPKSDSTISISPPKDRNSWIAFVELSSNIEQDSTGHESVPLVQPKLMQID